MKVNARVFIWLVVLGLGLLPAATGRTAEASVDPLLSRGWTSFKERFLTPEGRIVDTANGGISHSEGQGYGLLLAAAADDRAAFARIWTWTRTRLAVRSDGLLAWLWKPDANPPIADVNNASDGDLLVAWALLRAADRWGHAGYRADGLALAANLARTTVREVGGRTLLLPGVHGFVHDGEATVNLSYWVFPALDRLAEAAQVPNRWRALDTTGRRLTAGSRFGRAGLPPDWMAIRPDGSLTRSRIFAPEFGYNAVRVPLHLIWAGATSNAALRRVHAFWSAHSRGRDMPLVTALDAGGPSVKSRGIVPGFLAVRAAVACARDGTRPDQAAFHVSPDDHYFSAALQLLTLLALQEGLPRCAPAS